MKTPTEKQISLYKQLREITEEHHEYSDQIMAIAIFMDTEFEKELREKIVNKVGNSLQITLENCACLGRDAYGEYIDRCEKTILNHIRKC